MTIPEPDREPEFEGGAQPVPDLPPDEPGPGRAALLVIIGLLVFFTLLMPVLWGLGALATVGGTIGTAGLVILWVTWGLILVAFVWLVWSMWHRSA